MAGYYGFTLDVRVSVRPPVCQSSIRFSFSDDNLSKYQYLVCALILWRSGLGLLMDKFRQIFTKLSAHDTTIVGYNSLMFLFEFVL